MSFFFNDTATTEIYTLSLHDALPIFPYTIALRTGNPAAVNSSFVLFFPFAFLTTTFLPQEALTGWLATVADFNPVTYLLAGLDRKSTRLNSSHANISYAVFCLKKKNT